MMQTHRLPSGGRIDRARALRFTFDGRALEGFAGDTLASALLANGIALVARSFKYHRPRGIVASGVEEPNAIVQLGSGAHSIPNARATDVELHDGLSAASVSGWPSLRFDAIAAAGFLAPLMPAGFYYKTFMWPRDFWPMYEKLIRKAAGLGRAPSLPDADRYDKTHAHCDVLVVGGGPSGLAAALAAARRKADVIVADLQPEFGGSLLNLGHQASQDFAEAIGESPASWLARFIAELVAMPNVRMLSRSTVFGYHDQNFLTIAERRTDHLPTNERRGTRERIWRVRAAEVILATGALERPIVFANNDRPGVMLADAVSAYVNRYAVRVGSRAVLFTNNDGAYRTALDLGHAGIDVAAIVDPRDAPQGRWPMRARQAGIPIIDNAVVVDVRGKRRIRAAVITGFDRHRGEVTGATRTIACDVLAVSGGYNPTVHLHAQSGARPRFDDAIACFVPGRSVQAEQSVGACNGCLDVAACVAEGERAGTAASEAIASQGGARAVASRANDRASADLEPLWLVSATSRRAKQFVDLQNDVTANDIALAAREGYRSIEHVKRYTVLGFGTDQGKLGNINGMAILARRLGQDIATTGTTTFRPNYTPVTFGAIAGRDTGPLFDPIRKTPLHAWHEAQGAVFEDVGQWKRPRYYPKSAERMHDAVDRECLAARNCVAIQDVSTLGKIDIHGPDAVELLERIYTNDWKTLDVGRCRYGLMLDENGMVMDDGVTTRIADDHYLMTTTTGGAARVVAWLERWLQTEWPNLRVHLTSVTDHWAASAVVGPRSRDVLARVCRGIDLAPGAFPYLASREATLAGIPVRIARVSFSGELAYEVYVCANEAQHVWDALIDAGAVFGIAPYGTEAMHVLRAEKGYVIVGQDTDGSVTPHDLGMGWIVSKKKKDFIGRRSLARSDTSRHDRKQLVGLLADDSKDVLPEGAQIVDDAAANVPVPMLGHVTSSYYSACCGRSIALALVRRGRGRIGERMEIFDVDRGVARATIAHPVFFDPQGTRQNA
ncbi:MAG TPA: sarcosine oxidase subunit alpha family protein [Casimicrobiaceae bacterium]|nr:sarcosine oxidase subunit alpha family protein [Casimicrobiaceae bacterium]